MTEITRRILEEEMARPSREEILTMKDEASGRIYDQQRVVEYGTSPSPSTLVRLPGSDEVTSMREDAHTPWQTEKGSCKDPHCFNSHENHIHVNKKIPPEQGIKMPIAAMSSDELRKNYEDRLVAEVNSWTDQKRGYVYKLLNAQGMRVNDAEELIRKAKFDEM